MPGRDIVVIGASAGGLPALIEILSALPADLPAAVFAVVHTTAEGGGGLVQVLGRATELEVGEPVDGARIEPGRVYVPRADHHLLIDDSVVLVRRGPQENLFRPAIDPLFRTAARWHGPKVIGVILSGGLDDGTYGMMVIKENGGVAIAQHPDDALVKSMPLSAIQNVEVDYILPAAEIGPQLVRSVAERPKIRSIAMKRKDDVAEAGSSSLEAGDLDGPPSVYTCPDCGGAMWQIQSGKLLRYRCHVGHGFTAVRALDERQNLKRLLASRARKMRLPSLAQHYETQAGEADAHRAGVGLARASGGPAPQARQEGQVARRPEQASEVPVIRGIIDARESVSRRDGSLHGPRLARAARGRGAGAARRR